MDDYTEMREDTKRRVLEMVDKLPDEPFCRWVLDIPGIYFVLRGAEVSYVGSTQSMRQRWVQQPLRNAVDSGMLTLRYKRPASPKKKARLREEAFFISVLQPKLNSL
ncbi:hypothetical protein LCGC14_1933050 [marine sediment metagenome]|uniref:GIY-YIG domain-containing protein n=1 Tax=marine sediment metagenome TaxID=412755 RepID=A0A0F9I187_9ZZZZ